MPNRLEDVVDAHHHLWDPTLRDYPWMRGLPELQHPFVAAQLQTALAGTPVTQTIVVQATGSDDETDWLLELTASEPLGPLSGVVGWVDLERVGVAGRLSELVARGPLLRGIRHQVHDETDPEWLLRPQVLDGLAAVADAGLVYDLLIRRRETPAAIAVAQALPELVFVIDHAAKPDIAGGEWASWRDSLAQFAALPNVVCKVSGLLTEAAPESWREQGVERYLLTTVELFGAERCLFGSDWPVSLLRADYSDVLAFADDATSSLSNAERDALFRTTATRVYGLTHA